MPEGGPRIETRARLRQCVGMSLDPTAPSSLWSMCRVLVTGMSGTGKSTALAALRTYGFEVVDTDLPGWTEWSDAEAGYVWREDRIAELLARDREVPLYGPEPCRIRAGSTGTSMRSSSWRDLILRQLSDVEPLLRATCTHEIDATQSVDAVVAELVAIGSRARPRNC